MFVGGFGDRWAFFCLFVCGGIFWFYFVFLKDLAQVDFNPCCTADLQILKLIQTLPDFSIVEELEVR